MSCPFYHWDHGYACIKTGKNVNEDIYYKYCRGYDYSDCPIYKGTEESSSSGSGCYLTTACTKAMGLSDDCYELETLRRYRDTYLKSAPGGQCDICEYYEIAPQIVRKINEKPNSLTIWQRVYEELIVPCVKLIETGKNEEAREQYTSYTKSLKMTYLQ